MTNEIGNNLLHIGVKNGLRLVLPQVGRFLLDIDLLDVIVPYLTKWLPLSLASCVRLPYLRLVVDRADGLEGLARWGVLVLLKVL